MPHRHGLRPSLGAVVVLSLLSTGLLTGAGAAAAATSDTVAPAVTSLAVEPNTVDASHGAVPVVVTAQLNDAASGTERALVRFGASTLAVELSPLSGTAQSGLWSGIVHVPAGTPEGPVDSHLTVSDAAGNSSTSRASVVQAVEGSPLSAGPITPPSAPGIGAATAGDASATVTWTAPSLDGGEAPHAYVITASPSGQRFILPASARTATVGRLANGVTMTLQVAAVNRAGTGEQSAASATVTPRLRGTIVVMSQPVASVIYGTASWVRVDLRTAGDVSVSGRPMELLARVGAAKTYELKARGTTDAAGQVVLRAVLPANSLLRVRHLADVVQAPDVAVRAVSVATRVSAAPRASRMRLGSTVDVRGGVAPAHPVGSTVRLQKRTSTGWANVATGQMTTTSAYAVRWKPTSAGSYTVRVIQPAHADHSTGISPAFAQRIDPESTIDVARAIRANSRITLAEVHVGGVSDRATPMHNLADLAAGALARRSSYGTAPGGSTTVDLRLLNALRRMGQLGTVTVSEVAGGSHASRSGHYSGKGIDITWVNGRHVGRGSGYQLVIDTCRAYGATQIFHPSNDPYGGHHNHVHCGWS